MRLYVAVFVLVVAPALYFIVKALESFGSLRVALGG